MANVVIEPEKKIVHKTSKYWRFGFVSCAVVFVFVMLMLAFGVFYVSQRPYFRDIFTCAQRMQVVGDALQRYEIKHDAYPDKLTDLVPDFISADKLQCPADKSSKSDVSFEYFKRATDAPGSAVLLQCRHHMSRNGNSLSTVLCYLKEGRVAPRPANEVTNK